MLDIAPAVFEFNRASLSDPALDVTGVLVLPLPTLTDLVAPGTWTRQPLVSVPYRLNPSTERRGLFDVSRQRNDAVTRSSRYYVIDLTSTSGPPAHLSSEVLMMRGRARTLGGRCKGCPVGRLDRLPYRRLAPAEPTELWPKCYRPKQILALQCLPNGTVTMGRPMVPKYLKVAGGLLLGLLLAGCYTDFGPVEVATTPVAPVNASLAATMAAGEKIKVTVYGEDALSGEYDISPTGYVSMPLVGMVKAVGHTPLEFGRILERKYRGFLQEPHVNVAIVTFKPFYVLGEVVTPGEYPYRSDLTVQAAAAMAGGFTYRASRSVVLIRHTGDDIWREYPLTEPVPIAPGDVIRIPERYF